jgi:hypothetical protein
MSLSSSVLSSSSIKNLTYAKKRTFLSVPSTCSAENGPLSRNANASVTCPVDKGHYTVVQTVTLPKEIPRGMFADDDPRATLSDHTTYSQVLRCGEGLHTRRR